MQNIILEHRKWLNKIIILNFFENYHYTVFTSKFICDHLYITLIYKSIFKTGTSQWTNSSAASTSGVNLPGNAPGSSKYTYFATITFHPLWKIINDSKSYVLTVPMIISFEVVNYFSSGKKFFSLFASLW